MRLSGAEEAAGFTDALATRLKLARGRFEVELDARLHKVHSAFDPFSLPRGARGLDLGRGPPLALRALARQRAPDARLPRAATRASPERRADLRSARSHSLACTYTARVSHSPCLRSAACQRALRVAKPRQLRATTHCAAPKERRRAICCRASPPRAHDCMRVLAAMSWRRLSRPSRPMMPRARAWIRAAAAALCECLLRAPPCSTMDAASRRPSRSLFWRRHMWPRKTATTRVTARDLSK